MTSKKENDLAVGTVVNHYTIDSIIGRGAIGNVYKVKSDFSDINYSIKIESFSSKEKQLNNEYEVLSKLQESHYFPNLIDHYNKKPYVYNVIELCGPSIELIQKNLPDHIYSPSCAIFIAIKMLKAIRELHQQGFVHCDIKPNNFLIRSNFKYPIVLIDFGIAKKYLDDNGNHIDYENGCQFVGTYKYSSLNVMKGESPSRRDDLISWFYSVVELYTGRLPWPGAKNVNKTIHLKESISPSKLIKNMPNEFISIYSRLNNLQFSDEPPYGEILSLLIKIKSRIPKTEGSKYDWDYLTKEKIEEISPIGAIVMKDEDIPKPVLPPEEPKKPKKKKGKNNNKECVIC